MENKETLEGISEWYIETSAYMNLTPKDFIKFGAKWQKERMYSEEDLLKFGELVLDTFHSEGRTKSGKDRLPRIKFKEWFENFKKK